MRNTNRRLWSHVKARGDKPVIEYSSPQSGVIRTVTKLEMDCHPNSRAGLSIFLIGIGAPLSATLARTQDEAQ